jgi:hypothetical protein
VGLLDLPNEDYIPDIFIKVQGLFIPFKNIKSFRSLLDI